MKMKKLLAFVMSAVTIVGLTACGSQNADTATSSATTEETEVQETTDDGSSFKIIITTNKTGLAFQNRVAQAAEKRADELGIEWKYLDFKESEIAVEAEVAEQAITEQVDGVLWMPVDDEGSKQTVQSLLDEGIKMVSYIDPIANDDVVYVGSNNVDGAGSGLAAREMCEALGGEGKIVYIKGVSGFITQEVRDEAFKAVIDEYPGIEVVFEQNGNWDMESGGALMDDAMIKYPNAGDIDAVFCHNDAMALGAMEVIKTAGRDNEGIKVFGIDGEYAFLESIKNGAGTATAFQNAEQIGVTAVETLYRMMKGEDVGKSVDVAWSIVNSDNCEEFLSRWSEADKMYNIPEEYKDPSIK